MGGLWNSLTAVRMSQLSINPRDAHIYRISLNEYACASQKETKLCNLCELATVTDLKANISSVGPSSTLIYRIC